MKYLHGYSGLVKDNVWTAGLTSSNTAIIMAHSQEALRTMIKERLEECIKNRRNVAWNDDNDKEVKLTFQTEYEGNDKTTSPTVTYITNLFINGNKTILRERTIRNKHCTDNPECQICHKKVTRVYDVIRPDHSQGKVCKQCVKLNAMACKIHN